MKDQSKQICVHLLLNTMHTIQHVFIIFLTQGDGSKFGFFVIVDFELLGYIKMVFKYYFNMIQT